MNELIVLGTGNAMVTKCYNTCFALHSAKEYILVDTGGGNGILAQLEKSAISVLQIHTIIITHEHCDHILGVVWMIRKIGTEIKKGTFKGNLTIYTHLDLIPSIKTLCQLTLQQKFIDLFDDRILFTVVEDDSVYTILDNQVTFFDIHSTKAKQYGFEIEYIKDGNKKKLVCLGDEPLNTLCKKRLNNADWVLCEAFCLYRDRDEFKPYEKHHSTVKEACEVAEIFNVPHLVLWHTEDKNYENRKELYTTEGHTFYTGDLQVPYDLEKIQL
jgi:ribonuclease Z